MSGHILAVSCQGASRPLGGVGRARPVPAGPAACRIRRTPWPRVRAWWREGAATHRSPARPSPCTPSGSSQRARSGARLWPRPRPRSRIRHPPADGPTSPGNAERSARRPWRRRGRGRGRAGPGSRLSPSGSAPAPSREVLQQLGLEIAVGGEVGQDEPVGRAHPSTTDAVRRGRRPSGGRPQMGTVAALTPPLAAPDRAFILPAVSARWGRVSENYST